MTPGARHAVCPWPIVTTCLVRASHSESSNSVVVHAGCTVHFSSRPPFPPIDPTFSSTVSAALALLPPVPHTRAILPPVWAFSSKFHLDSGQVDVQRQTKAAEVPG